LGTALFFVFSILLRRLIFALGRELDDAALAGRFVLRRRHSGADKVGSRIRR
jgi:hypothetical protein